MNRSNNDDNSDNVKMNRNDHDEDDHDYDRSITNITSLIEEVNTIEIYNRRRQLESNAIHAIEDHDLIYAPIECLDGMRSLNSESTSYDDHYQNNNNKMNDHSSSNNNNNNNLVLQSSLADDLSSNGSCNEDDDHGRLVDQRMSSKFPIHNEHDIQYNLYTSPVVHRNHYQPTFNDDNNNVENDNNNEVQRLRCKLRECYLSVLTMQTNADIKKCRYELEIERLNNLLNVERNMSLQLTIQMNRMNQQMLKQQQHDNDVQCNHHNDIEHHYDNNNIEHHHNNKNINDNNIKRFDQRFNQFMEQYQKTIIENRTLKQSMIMNNNNNNTNISSSHEQNVFVHVNQHNNRSNNNSFEIPYVKKNINNDTNNKNNDNNNHDVDNDDYKKRIRNVILSSNIHNNLKNNNNNCIYQENVLNHSNNLVTTTNQSTQMKRQQYRPTYHTLSKTMLLHNNKTINITIPPSTTIIQRNLKVQKNSDVENDQSISTTTTTTTITSSGHDIVIPK